MANKKEYLDNSCDCNCEKTSDGSSNMMLRKALMLSMIFMLFAQFATATSPTCDDPRLVETVTVDSTDADGIDSTSILQSHLTYRLDASGEYKFSDPSTRRADAEYISFDNWATTDRDVLGVTLPEDASDLLLNKLAIDWGSYSPSHDYEYLMSGTGSTINLQIDDWYLVDDPWPGWNCHENYPDCMSDNSGSIDVNIYCCATPEVCDGLDNDCDGVVDNGLTFDVDGDGLSTPNSCQGTKNDCDDNAITCGLDCSTKAYADTDGDNFGDPATETRACDAPAGYILIALDCDDTVKSCNLDCTTDIDQDAKRDCDDTCNDADGDNYGLPFPAGNTCDGVDCDDTVAACNADCVTPAYADADSDGFGDFLTSHRACDAPDTYISDNTDCDDTDDERSPALSEVCDGKDNDCDFAVDEGFDFDGDTIADCFDNCEFVFNLGQQDSDQDTYGDVCDTCPYTYNIDQLDTDGDTIGDVCDNCEVDSNLHQENFDGDSHGNVCDNCILIDNEGQVNNDNDALGDACDNCPEDDNQDQANADADNYGDACDNCPNVVNNGQANSDTDMWGDACDNCDLDDNDDQADGDADTIGDVCDNCAQTANTDQLNSDTDAFGDACDNCDLVDNDQTNSDTDNFGDACDNCDLKDNNDQLDGDSDTIGDVCDNCPSTANPGQEDTDNEGVGDACDNCINDANPDQLNSDTDSFGDACDGCPTDGDKIAPGLCGCGVADTDTDNDGTPDCTDECDDDANKILVGICGCGIADTNSDGDSLVDCNDNCPQVTNEDQSDLDSDTIGDACDTESDADSCSDGLDNDGDGDIDCFDVDCKDASPCQFSCVDGQKAGDADGDGLITETDSLLVVKMGLGLLNTPSNLCCTDLDNSGILSAADAFLITQIRLGISPELGLCGPEVDQTACSDGLDNDRDGKTNCADEGCAGLQDQTGAVCCQSASTCDDQNDCTTDTCEQNVCGSVNAQSGIDCMDETGICKRGVCDTTPFVRECGNGVDLCQWNVDLPLGSDDNFACGTDYNTYWPLESTRTVSCTFDASDFHGHTLYTSIDNDIVSCTLNGVPLAGFPYHSDGCAPSDPRGSNNHVLAIEPVNGQNTIVCEIYDVPYPNGMNHYDACMVGDTPNTCGDGLIWGNEECDDGNEASGDGCSSECVVESLYTCEGEPSNCCKDSDEDSFFDVQQATCCMPASGDFAPAGDGGDGLPTCDVCPGFDDSQDADSDTVPDGCDVCPGSDDRIDTDADGVPNGCDICEGSDDRIDTDADGVPNGCDNCVDNANPPISICSHDSPLDKRGKACSTDDDCKTKFLGKWYYGTCVSEQQDSDNDGLGNVCDNCPTRSNSDQTDSDGDGIGDACDNCASISNADQADGDNDGKGNVCDNCATIFNPFQTNTDGDSLGNMCDNCWFVDNEDQANSDGDIIGDACDNCPLVDNLLQQDSDNDGNGNSCDICPGFDDNVDTDEDTVPDGCDICQGSDDRIDTDEDTVPDGCDICPGSDDRIDTDGDGVPDGCDNCVDISNADQANDDGDLLGDACDACPDDTGNDADSDGYCAAACESAPVDFTENGAGGFVYKECGDCNDNDANINPGMAEVCGDCFDNNCDSLADCDDGTCSTSESCDVPVCSAGNQVLVDTVNVATNTATPTLGPITYLGMEYILKPVGTYDYGNGHSLADAECQYRPEVGFGQRWISGELEAPPIWQDGLDILVNGGNIAWGGYNTAHTYYKTIAGTGANVEFSIHDDGYTDNIGTVPVYVYGCALPENTNEACSDQADNDLDGLINCDDPDCQNTAACDADGDGIPNGQDNCVNDGNGPDLGYCSDEFSITCTSDLNCEVGTCVLTQADLDQDGIGDVCDPDADGDQSISCDEAAQPPGDFNPAGTQVLCDCDDMNAAIKPLATEVCDGIDNNCDGSKDEGFLNTDGDEMADCVDPDDDNDGFDGCIVENTEGDFTIADEQISCDCNDLDATIKPDATEVCNGVDDNCDGSTDEGFPNFDGDGMADCVDPDDDNDGVMGCDAVAGESSVVPAFDVALPNVVQCDCNDLNAAVSPNVAEVCNGIDDNCDGSTDEGFPDLDIDGIADCVDPDADGDGYFNPNSFDPRAEGGVALNTEAPACVDYDPENTDPEAVFCDCNDLNAAIHPGADDPLNDGIDQNCWNAPPQSQINDPAEGSVYQVYRDPLILLFNGVVSDEEDCLDVTWDFGNGDVVTYNNCDASAVVPTGAIISLPNGTASEDSSYGAGGFDITLSVVENNPTDVTPLSLNEDEPAAPEETPQTNSDTIRILINGHVYPNAGDTVTTTTPPVTTTTAAPTTTTAAPTTTTLPPAPIVTTTRAPVTTTTLQETGEVVPPVQAEQTPTTTLSNPTPIMNPSSGQSWMDWLASLTSVWFKLFLALILFLLAMGIYTSKRLILR